MAITINETGVITETVDIAPPRSMKHFLIGRPLATADAAHQTIGKIVGLAVFASDALSSTAYATQEILVILAAASAFNYALPIAIAIVTLMLIVTVSYQQTIHAYPGGGGAYIVARDNLGEVPAQMAGAALLTDYVLTVAVSTSSGVAQIVSAFPAIYNYRIIIAVGIVFLVMLVNLRGVKESGVTFAIPTYFFVITMFLTVIIGFVRYFTGTLGTVANPPEMMVTTVLTTVTPFLLLHAFSSGTSALTGIEAISNGITVFKEPRSKNAGITLLWMSAILATLFLGITFLSGKIGAVPSEMETVISQLTRTIYGGQGIMYLAVITGTSVILFMAANTAYADFPRLSALIAGDGFLPRQLSQRGSRLVFSRGIISLTLVSCLMIVLFQASVTKLIPLYAIGVFLSFTLSQSGMAYRWWKSGRLKAGNEIKETGSVLTHDRQWVFKMIINSLGAVCTFVVMLVFGYTKFKDGAWIVVLLMPVLMTIFLSIHRHYKRLAGQLSLNHFGSRRIIQRHRIIMPVGGVHRGTLEAIRYARTLSDDITAVYVSMDPLETEKVQKKWEIWGEGIRLVILDSPYRLFLEPFLLYVQRIESCCAKDQVITIVVPQFVPKNWWAKLLHQRTAETIRKSLVKRQDIVITEVPYQVE